MSEIYTEKQYISLIIEHLKTYSQIMEIDDDEELNEKDLDINSGNLFECLYYNLINFIKSNQNNNKVFSDIQKYLISEIVDILEILNEKKPNCFFKYDFVKSILIYLVYSFKTSINLNNENILKIFLSFNDLIESVSHRKI